MIFKDFVSYDIRRTIVDIQAEIKGIYVSIKRKFLEYYRSWGPHFENIFLQE